MLLETEAHYAAAFQDIIVCALVLALMLVMFAGAIDRD